MNTWSASDASGSMIRPMSAAEDEQGGPINEHVLD